MIIKVVERGQRDSVTMSAAYFHAVRAFGKTPPGDGASRTELSVYTMRVHHRRHQRDAVAHSTPGTTDRSRAPRQTIRHHAWTSSALRQPAHCLQPLSEILFTAMAPAILCFFSPAGCQLIQLPVKRPGLILSMMRGLSPLRTLDCYSSATARDPADRDPLRHAHTMGRRGYLADSGYCDICHVGISHLERQRARSAGRWRGYQSGVPKTTTSRCASWRATAPSRHFGAGWKLTFGAGRLPACCWCGFYAHLVSSLPHGRIPTGPCLDHDRFSRHLPSRARGRLRC